ncbi:MAG: M81 family metallopeptidase [Synergistaceae bacterium]|jgi:microcystin degradation protein MlrC|nr:M81 family metallopeptidase [Synergistaceae bacterium]
MKIAICQFIHETTTFSQQRSDFESMAKNGWSDSKDVIPKYRDTPSYIGGAIRGAQELGAELIPISSMFGSAGPLILRECVDRVIGVMQRELRVHRREIDGVFCAMHGGGCAEDIDDLEIHILKKLREVVGDKPIMSSLDLHSNITQEMVSLSDGLFGIKEYPHVDMAEAGYLAIKCLIKKIRQEINPVMALVRLPVLLTAVNCSTFTEPMKSVKEHVAAYCENHGLIDATFFHGFAYSDQASTGASVLTIADGRQPKAEALELANFFWDRRYEFVAESLMPDQALDIALKEVRAGFAIINETSDNPGSGTPGDGTHLLRELIKRDVPQSILGYIVDPEAAEICHKAGVSAKVDMWVGGKADHLHGEPIYIQGAEVINLSDGKIVFKSSMRRGESFKYGKSVRIRYGHVEIIIVSNRCQTLDDRPFLMTGADLSDYKIVGIKSSVHFRAFFQPLADVIVASDPPGPNTANFKSLTYTKIHRPIFPIDEDARFDPEN